MVASPARDARRLLAHRYLGRASWDVAVNWAIHELEEGRDSESLRILAGLTPPGAWSDVDEWLPKAFAELGYEWSPEEPCLRAYAVDVAADIVDGVLSPDKGCSEIYQ